MTAPALLAQLPPSPAGRSGWPWTTETPAPADFSAVAWPRISVVMPSYQQAAYLEEGLRSVLLQNYPNLEFIVNDGGSSDGSAAILERYAPHLAHAQSQRDGGQGPAINQGLDRATGEILGWLNSDDLYLPGALFAVARRFLAGDADVVYGDALNLHEAKAGALEYWQGYWVHPAFLQFGGVISSHAVFWRRAVHERLWDELHCNVDGELWQRLIPGRRVRYLPLPLGACRQHPASKSQAEGWRRKWAEDDQRIWARHGAPRHGRIFRAWFSRSQRVFKWFTWRRNRPAKRAILAACHWAGRPWLGPQP